MLQVHNPSASFTRPNDTTPYATGDLVANSVTAGSVIPMQFSPGNSGGQGVFRLVRARLTKSGTSVTNATFRIHLYEALPTPANGDNGAWSTDQALHWLGNIDISSMLAFTDGAQGTGSLPAGSEAFVRCQAGSTIYALISALGVYTPAAGEIFTLTPEFVTAW
jgi:hypothetical protein